jgi:ABC-2 type transport system permease protein
MRQLIWKDFILQKKAAYIYVAMGSVFFFYFDAMDQRNMLAVMIPTFMIVYGFMNRSLAEDDKNHTLRMLVSLPISRASIVRAKYASIGLVALITTVIFLCAGSIMGAFHFRDADQRLIDLLIMSAFTCVCTLLISIFIPLVYKIGAVRAQSINRFIFFGVFALGTTVGTLASTAAKRIHLKGSAPAWLDGIGRALSGLADVNPYVYVVLLFVLSGCIYLGSMRTAVRFLERREMF